MQTVITYNESLQNLKKIEDIQPNDFKIIGTMWKESTGTGDYSMELDLDESYDYNAFQKSDLFIYVMDMIYAKSARCNHCNKKITYVMLGLKNDGTFNIFGHKCTENMLMYQGLSFESIQKRSLNSMVKEKNEAKRLKFLTANEGLELAFQAKNEIIQNIRESFTKYCKISEKQVELVFKLAKKQAEFDAINNERETTACDVPDVRVIDEKFLVISIKKEADAFTNGKFNYKSVLESVVGKYRVFGNLPTLLVDSEGDVSVKVGEVICITTTLTRSSKNPKFGFFKRAVGSKNN